MQARQASPNLCERHPRTISSDRAARENARTVQRLVDESDQEDRGRREPQFCESEIAHVRIRHLEIAGWWIGRCSVC